MATILIATEDSLAYGVLSAEIEGEGFEVLWAQDGYEAIELTRAQKPSAVFMESKLSIFNGFEVAETLRSDPDVPADLPIYLYEDDAVEPHRFEQAGFTAQFLKKHAYQDIREILAPLVILPAVDL